MITELVVPVVTERILAQEIIIPGEEITAAVVEANVITAVVLEASVITGQVVVAGTTGIIITGILKRDIDLIDEIDFTGNSGLIEIGY